MTSFKKNMLTYFVQVGKEQPAGVHSHSNLGVVEWARALPTGPKTTLETSH